MAKIYKKEIDLFISHKNEKGEDVFYTGQVVLQQLLSYLGININALSKEIGWTRPDGLYRIRDGATKTISAEVAADIYRRYNNIDVFWLITGEGKMLKEGQKEDFKSEVQGVNLGPPDQDPLSNLERIVKDQEEYIQQLGVVSKKVSEEIRRLKLLWAQSYATGSGEKKNKTGKGLTEG